VDGVLVLIELVLVFGLVLGFGVWELRRVRRAQRADRTRDDADEPR